MVLISKNDKNIWKNYVSNFEQYVFVPQVNDRSISKNNFYNPHNYKKDNPSIYTKSFKKKGAKPNVVLDLHGHTLYSAKIILNKSGENVSVICSPQDSFRSYLFGT